MCSDFKLKARPNKNKYDVVIAYLQDCQQLHRVTRGRIRDASHQTLRVRLEHVPHRVLLALPRPARDRRVLRGRDREPNASRLEIRNPV